MKVRIIESNQEDNEGTLYNVLDIMYVYVMFDGHTTKNIKKIILLDVNFNTIMQNNEQYIVTLYTNNNTYINVSEISTEIKEIEELQNSETLVKNDKIIYVTSTIFIKGIMRLVKFTEQIVYGEELPLDHDIFYPNICKADENYCMHVFETKFQLDIEVNRFLYVENFILNSDRNSDEYLLILQIKEKINSIIDNLNKSKSDVINLQNLLRVLIIVIVGLIVYKNFFFKSKNVVSDYKGL